MEHRTSASDAMMLLNLGKMIGRCPWQQMTRTMLVLLLLTAACSACPTCKDGISDPQFERMARGYFYSILFMMSMPFAILGSFGSYAYFTIRKAQRDKPEPRPDSVAR